jgi:hypothetical protein
VEIIYPIIAIGSLGKELTLGKSWFAMMRFFERPGCCRRPDSLVNPKTTEELALSASLIMLLNEGGEGWGNIVA